MSEDVDDAAIFTPEDVADLRSSSSRPSMSKMPTSSRPSMSLICFLLTPEYDDDHCQYPLLVRVSVTVGEQLTEIVLIACAASSLHQ